MSDLPEKTLRVGSLTLHCRLGDPYYAALLDEFFKGNLSPAGANERRDATLDIVGAAHDPELFPGDDTSFLHPILAGAEPGGFSYTTCLCRVEVDTTTPTPHIAVRVPEPSPTLESWRIHFLRTIPKVIFPFDRYYLHASAVRCGGTVSVFTGGNHAGKSTVALRLAREAAEMVADDHVLLRRRDGRFYVSGTDRNARVCATTERYLFERPLATDARLHGRLWKKEFSIGDHFPVRAYRDHRLGHLYFLARGTAPQVRPLPPAQAIIRLLTLQNQDYLLSINRPDETDAYLAYFTDLLRAVPAHELVLTDDLADLDRLAPQILERR